MFYPQFLEGRTFVPDAESVGGAGGEKLSAVNSCQGGPQQQRALGQATPSEMPFWCTGRYLWRVLYPTSVGLAKAQSNLNCSLTSPSTPSCCLLLPVLGKYPAPKFHISISFQTTQPKIWGKLEIVNSWWEVTDTLRLSDRQQDPRGLLSTNAAGEFARIEPLLKLQKAL